MRGYYFPIFHKGEPHADDVGELFGSAQLAVQYGARVARDIASDLDYDFSQAASSSESIVNAREARRWRTMPTNSCRRASCTRL